jgi:HPt (histidine-containing phosphotransfer) domain-containing protein
MRATMMLDRVFLLSSASSAHMLSTFPDVQSLLDEAALDRIRSFGGNKLLRGMIELFVKNAPTKAAEAREALDCGDAAALRAALHGLKSSAGQLGAVSVHGACVAGEELASRGELSQCTEHVRRIEQDLPVACRQLEALGASS